MLTLHLAFVPWRMKMLSGASRKIALLLVFLSACGWVVFVTGFGIRNAEIHSSNSNSTVVESRYFSHWCLSVSGAVLYFLYFLHLLWGNVVTGMVTMLVVPLYLAMVGAVLQFDSSDSNGGSFPDMIHNDDFEVHLLVEYVGTLVAGGFLWVALVLWPLHTYKRSTADYEPINN